MQKNMRSKLTRVFAAVFCVLTLVSCSIDARLENKELNWAVEPTFSGAWAFSNHAGLTLDDFSTARFIGSDGEALFLDLHLDLSDCVGDDEDASRQWSTQHFVSGVFKNPQFELSRSGKISETTEKNYTIKGNSVRIGQLYVQAVETNNGILDTYYGVMYAQGEWVEEPVFCDFAVLPQGCCWLQYGGSSPYTVMITSEGKINRIPQTLYLSSRSAISDADAEDPWYAMHDISLPAAM